MILTVPAAREGGKTALMVKNDRWICEMAAKGMIEPFAREQIGSGVISFGVSSYGYDIRLADEFKVPQFPEGTVIDPKNFHAATSVDVRGEQCEIAPNSYLLCRSLEYLRIPRETLVICFGKSTYARIGVIVNITPLEPEWEGFITICVSNTGRFPVRLHAGEGIAQLVFLGAADVCVTSYADRKGKYQTQQGIVVPRV